MVLAYGEKGLWLRQPRNTRSGQCEVNEETTLVWDVAPAM